MRRTCLLFCLLLLLAPSLAFAQAPVPGQYFGLRSSSGRYLSATGSEQIILTTHLAGWEQWQYVDYGGGHRVIQSFHGTVLSMLSADRKPIHTVDFWSTKPGDELIALQLTASTGMAADEVALFFTWAGDQALAEQPDGSLGFLTSYGPVSRPVSPLPPNARWKVVPIPQPAGGRQPLKKGLQDVEYRHLQSTHGTFLMEGFPSKTVQWSFDVVHLPLPAKPGYSDVARISLVQGAMKAGNVLKPIHFGETIYLSWLHAEGSYFLRPGTEKNPNGLTRAESKWSGNSMAQTEWAMFDPTGFYKPGERVPQGVPVLLQSSATKLYLSANGSYSSGELTPNKDKWEYWTIIP